MNVYAGAAIGFLLIAFLFMFLVALAEVSLATISRAHVRKLGEQGVSSALVVDKLLQDAERFLSGVLVLRTLAIGSAAAAVTWLALYFRWAPSIMAAALVGAGLALLLLQVIARVLAVQKPQPFAFRLARPIQFLTTLAAPITWILLRIIQRAGLREGQSARDIFMSEDGLRLLLNFGEEERFIEAEEREMIDSIFRFSETTVGEVMVPRVDVVALEQNATLGEALDTIVAGGHSRIPIFDETIDKMVGVLYAKDLLATFRDDAQQSNLKDLMRTPYFVPESAMVGDLLEDLQHKKVHVAIVVDEYGGTAGIVTIEDLLEEIVGEIQDEYDAETPLLQQLAPRVFEANGRIDIDDLNRELEINLVDEDESYTLAGVIYSHLQRVPAVGDTLDLGNVHMVVEAVTDNRIDRVRLEVGVAGDEGEMAEALAEVEP